MKFLAILLGFALVNAPGSSQDYLRDSFKRQRAQNRAALKGLKELGVGMVVPPIDDDTRPSSYYLELSSRMKRKVLEIFKKAGIATAEFSIAHLTIHSVEGRKGTWTGEATLAEPARLPRNGVTVGAISWTYVGSGDLAFIDRKLTFTNFDRFVEDVAYAFVDDWKAANGKH